MLPDFKMLSVVTSTLGLPLIKLNYKPLRLAVQNNFVDNATLGESGQSSI